MPFNAYLFLLTLPRINISALGCSRTNNIVHHEPTFFVAEMRISPSLSRLSD